MTTASATVGTRPVTVNRKQILSLFLEHRREVITRRTKFRLDRAERRAHILEGYLIALDELVTVPKWARRTERTRREVARR